MRLRLSISVWLLCVAVTVSVCASRTDAETHSQKIHRGDAGAPSNQLGDGFTVARGSVLIGTVFPGHSLTDRTPTQYGFAGDDIWTAVLGLEGNPIKVLNRYLRQAQDAGFEIGAQCRLTYRYEPRAPSEVASSLEVPPSDRLRNPDELRQLACDAVGGAAANGASRPAEQLTIELRRSAGGAPYEDNILIRFARLAQGERPTRFAPSGRLATLPTAWETGVPRPPEPPDLATTGTPIRRVDPVFARPIDVVEETRLLAPRALPCPWRGGFDAVLEISGDVDEVLDAYAMQFHEIGMTSERNHATFRNHDATIDQGVGDSGNYGAVAVEGTEAEATHLHLWFCPTN